MEFTHPEVVVYNDIQGDPSVDEQAFRQAAMSEAGGVWSERNLASTENTVSEFEDAHEEMDVSGRYVLTDQSGELKVVVHPGTTDPLDPALGDNAESGSIPPHKLDELNDHLNQAKESVADRLTSRLDEFVTED